MRCFTSLRQRALAAVAGLALLATACGDDGGDGAGSDGDGEAQAATSEPAGTSGGTGGEEDTAADDSGFEGPLVIGAIPDQDPEVLARNYDLVADYLSGELGIDVEFQPVTDYEAAVSTFRVGDLHLVWFGGLTGVQARLQVDGAEAIAQRDIDAEFTSVFIAGTDTGLEPVDDVSGLSELAGHTFTFGSESSTSGRLMPQHFLDEAGVSIDDLAGEPGYSGSHDTTISLVESGTYEAGVLNSQVWDSRVDDGSVDTSEVQVILETPTYYDYHWVARPELGDELKQDIIDALGALDSQDPEHAEILDFFGAESFIETENGNYDEIEQVGREVGMIEE